MGSHGSDMDTAMPMPGHRILFLDAYDSFTNNIVSLLTETLDHVEVDVLHMDLKTLHSDPEPDWSHADFISRLAAYDAVVCGPGPGSPLRASDVGVFRVLWDLPSHLRIPVFGICLGFQSLVEHFGANIRKLQRGLHGMIREIEHLEQSTADIFHGVPPFKATLYHSLCADIGQDDIPENNWSSAKWASFSQTPNLVPLAWATERSELGDERILMGVRHSQLPFWGVQYHPESVCTEAAAHGVLKNWFRQALKWNAATGRRRASLSRVKPEIDRPLVSPTTSYLHEAFREDWRLARQALSRDPSYTYRRLKLPSDGINAADVAEILRQGDVNTIILDSSSSINGDPLARNSIIALEVENAPRIEYCVPDEFVTLHRPGQGGSTTQIPLTVDKRDPFTIWRAVSEFWQLRKLESTDVDAPTFQGGFMGFVSYEMGLSTVSQGSVSQERGHKRPDLCMAWITKSVVLDHKAGWAYVQDLESVPETSAWIDEVADTLESLPATTQGPDNNATPVSSHPTRTPNLLLKEISESKGRLRFKLPDADDYERDVVRCQDAIREGESYELCLTARTTMTRPRGDDRPHHLRQPPETQRSQDLDEESRHGTPWQIYRALRARQPAPFGSFIRLGGATIISSSPERFLSHTPSGLCRMRPMKGTVRKSAAVSTLAQAEKILHIPKEEAENLMIVDLVRHDLYGVCGTGQVSVPELLKVEEYASVFQMVTAVNGQVPASKWHGPLQQQQQQQQDSAQNGLGVLAEVLPPGSMTGAPKKRSCEIIQGLEPSERSIYSGVVGYVDAKGQGDWSVTIRTMFRWDDEAAEEEEEEESPLSEPPIGNNGASSLSPSASLASSSSSHHPHNGDCNGAANGEDEKSHISTLNGSLRDSGDHSVMHNTREVWRIGAGGAVTILSTPVGEREEMLTKLCGPLGIFKDVA